MSYKLIVLGVVILHSTACSFPSGQPVGDLKNRTGSINSSMDKDAEISDDIEVLAQNINLPFRPAEAKWQAKTMGNLNSSVPGPTDYELTAVLKYTDADAQMLIKRLEEIPVDKKIGSIKVKEWFPEDVRSAAQKINDQIVIEGANYSPDLYLRSPYSGGKLIRVGNTNNFVLVTFTS